MDCSPPGSSVHEISRQGYWSGLPFPSQGIFPTQGLNPGLLHCRQILHWLSYKGNPPSIRVFSNETALCIKWPKYWSFSFNIRLPMNTQDWSPLEWTGWISLQSKGLSRVFSNTTHSSKASIVQLSAFFIIQLSHPYITIGKTIALTKWTFVGKIMSLPFNKLSRLVITFLPRSKHLLISWLQSPSAVILEPQKNKVYHCFHCFPIYLPWSDGTKFYDLSFLNVKF